MNRYLLVMLLAVLAFLVGLWGGNWQMISFGEQQPAHSLRAGGPTCRLSETEKRVLAEFWRERDPSTPIDTTFVAKPNMQRLRETGQ